MMRMRERVVPVQRLGRHSYFVMTCIIYLSQPPPVPDPSGSGFSEITPPFASLFIMRNFSLLFFVFGISIGQAQTIGLLEYSPGNLDGYVLFAPIPSTTTYLIDKCGREVHAWPSAYKPGQSVYMLDNGSLIRPASIPNNVFTAGGKAGAVERISWDGVLEWSYQVSDTGQCSHHDVYPMPNGHVLVLAWEKVSVAEALAQGRDPALLTNSLWPEKILELEPIGENQANIVWEWHTWDHLVQEFDDTKPNFAPTSEHPELVDLNYGNGMAQADWIHANALDYNADLDQIMISAHNFDELWVIDHSTTTAEAASHSGGTQGHGGDLLYRWGNPEAYGRGTEADKRLFGQHNTQWIRPGLPRAGEVLVFNNGAGRPGGQYSSVDIFETPVDGNGGYPIGVGVPFAPGALDFQWTEPVPTDLFAQRISGAQQLPNGGLLVCDGPAGSLFELGTNNEKVWRYISPVNLNGPMTQGAPAILNTVFRCTWIASNHPGLNGHDLTPGDPIELEPLANACTTTNHLEEAENPGLMVFPDPTSGPLQLSLNGGISSVSVTDAQGRSMGVHPLVSATGRMSVDLSSLADGIYLIQAEQDGKRFTSRVLVSR